MLSKIRGMSLKKIYIDKLTVYTITYLLVSSSHVLGFMTRDVRKISVLQQGDYGGVHQGSTARCT